MSAKPQKGPPELAPWQQQLQKAMFFLGHAIEKAIDSAKSYKRNLPSAKKRGPDAVVALEGQLTLAKLREAITLATERIIRPLIPALLDRTAMELSDGAPLFMKTFKEKGVHSAINVNIETDTAAPKPSAAGDMLIKALPTNIPFEDGYFDYIVALLASTYQRDIIKAIKEVARVLVVNGEAIITDFHPFGLFAKKGSSRMKPVLSSIRGMEDYYRLFASVGLEVVGVKEAYFDEIVRGLFITAEDKAVFRNIKDTPLFIQFTVRKGAA